MEGANLKEYLRDLFESILGSDIIEVVKIDSAFRIGIYRNNMRPRDVLIKFADWNSKKLVMMHLCQFGNVTVEGLEVQAFADLAPSTLQKRKDLKFFTDRLQQRKITYTWGVPFRLLLYRNKKKDC